MNMKKICLSGLLAVLFFVPCFAQVSVGGSIDGYVGTNQSPLITGSFNVEYKPVSIFSAGVKGTAQTDLQKSLALTPSFFARLYPFSGAFAECSAGYQFSILEKNFTSSFVAGGSVGWRITSGNTYVEPKLSFSYVPTADEPFSWAGGVGAGYSF